MLNNLSVVHIIPAAHRKVLNDFAEACGCGENNLRIILESSQGEVFYGCHSMWVPDDYLMFTDASLREHLLGSIDNRGEVEEVLSVLYERCVLDPVNPYTENWLVALEALGLVKVGEDL